MLQSQRLRWDCWDFQWLQRERPPVLRRIFVGDRKGRRKGKGEEEGEKGRRRGRSELECGKNSGGCIEDDGMHSQSKL